MRNPWRVDQRARCHIMDWDAYQSMGKVSSALGLVLRLVLGLVLGLALWQDMILDKTL